MHAFAARYACTCKNHRHWQKVHCVTCCGDDWMSATILYTGEGSGGTAGAPTPNCDWGETVRLQLWFMFYRCCSYFFSVWCWCTKQPNIVDLTCEEGDTTFLCIFPLRPSAPHLSVQHILVPALLILYHWIRHLAGCVRSHKAWNINFNFSRVSR